MSNLVTFEQAVQLKKLGYNKGSYNFYLFDKAKETEDSLTEHGKFDNWNLLDHLNLHIGYATAPTVSEALDWIREEKGIPCSVHLEFEENNKEWFYYGEYGIKGDNRIYDTETFDTHSLASSTLLDAVLNYLEERTDV